jgi:archaeal flagellar protein FlaI
MQDKKTENKKEDIFNYTTERKTIDQYTISLDNQVISVEIYTDINGFSHYDISIVNITKSTRIILDKIREEFISKINLGMIDLNDESSSTSIKELFKEEILLLINKYFPRADKETSDLLVNELMRQNIGLGDIEILLKDPNLEEIVVNSAKEPVQIYHKRYGWLLTNIVLPTEKRIRHYSTVIGSEVGKEITLLKPLMDARLLTGDRVNATLSPISSHGNTITIRKFATRPWTITDFLKDGTISYPGAALIWLAVENELSVIISGGTGSGKTSMLNVVSSFIPVNQRTISIEDTRELQLPKELHWVPLETRLPNPEGKGGVTMLDLVVNSLRMRPDRIIMGEVRRREEAEVLFEAMHTGHSVYATFHANNVRETVERFTNPPIDLPKMLLSSLGLIVVQSRNRRTGKRRTLQIAEMLSKGEFNVLMQYDINRDVLLSLNDSKSIIETLKIFTGMTKKQIEDDINEKIRLLKQLVKKDITDINHVGMIFRSYYNKKRDAALQN